MIVDVLGIVFEVGRTPLLCPCLRTSTTGYFQRENISLSGFTPNRFRGACVNRSDPSARERHCVRRRVCATSASLWKEKRCEKLCVRRCVCITTCASLLVCRFKIETSWEGIVAKISHRRAALEATRRLRSTLGRPRTACRRHRRQRLRPAHLTKVPASVTGKHRHPVASAPVTPMP
jgi:hypothetical protein